MGKELTPSTGSERSDCIKNIRNLADETAEKYRDLILEEFLSSFYSLRSKTFGRMETLPKEEDEERIRKEGIWLTYGDFTWVKERLAESSKVIAKDVLTFYKIMLDIIFDDQEFSHLKQRYELSADIEIQQIAQISRSVGFCFENLIKSSYEAERIRQNLIQLYPNYAKYSGINAADVSVIFRGAASGLLFVVNPLAGIASALFTYHSASQEDSKKNHVITTYIENWNAWIKLFPEGALLKNTISDLAEYLDKKLKETFVGTISEIISTLVSANYNVDHVQYAYEDILEELQKNSNEHTNALVEDANTRELVEAAVVVVDAVRTIINFFK